MLNGIITSAEVLKFSLELVCLSVNTIIQKLVKEAGFV